MQTNKQVGNHHPVNKTLHDDSGIGIIALVQELVQCSTQEGVQDTL